MKTIQKIRKVGTSLVVTIPKNVIKEIQLNENDKIIMDIQTIKPSRFVCLNCNHEFNEVSDINNFCPKCNCEYIIQLSPYNTNTHLLDKSLIVDTLNANLKGYRNTINLLIELKGGITNDKHNSNRVKHSV